MQILDFKRDPKTAETFAKTRARAVDAEGIAPADSLEAADQEPPAAPKTTTEPRAFYDRAAREFLVKNDRGIWLALAESPFKRTLRAAGISTKIPEGETLSAADRAILEAQNRHDVDFAGQLCGRPEGFFESGGTRILCTRGIELAEPAPGSWPTLRAFFEGLLNDPEHAAAQLAVFYGWLRAGQIALRVGKIQASQALALAGPPGCGKSLAQAIITILLGGRSAKPIRYLSGATAFNSDLFGAEHLVLEDEFMGRKVADRVKLGASIKNVCVSARSQSCHAKGRQAVNLPAWWRLTISLNDDAEAMLVLPPLDEHFADKLILLRAVRFEFLEAMDTAEAQENFMQKCKAEASAFLHWLLTEFVLPDEFNDPRRYGVASWHHPALRSKLDTLSPEADLLALADQVLWADGADAWRGTSAQLQTLLVNDYSTGPGARKLLEFANACGTFLTRLAARPSPRVHEARTATRREFVIDRPQ